MSAHPSFGPLQRSPRWLLTLLVAALAAIAVVAAAPVSAHRNEMHPAPAQAGTEGGNMADRLTIGTQTPMGELMDMGKDRSQMSFLERALDWLGRTHPFIIHFPVAFFPAALFTAIVGRRRPAFIKPVQFLVVTGGLIAPVAAVFGWFNAGWNLTDTDSLLAVHRWLGTAIGLGGLGLGVWAWRQPEADRSTGMIIGLSLMTIAILIQGWFGGAMIHGIDHLNW